MDTCKADVDKNVDVLVYLRRFRMHGIALTLLLGRRGREFVSNRSLKKSYEGLMHAKKSDKKSWNELESLSYNNRLAVGMFRRYLDL